jgi:hypothetical protein
MITLNEPGPDPPPCAWIEQDLPGPFLPDIEKTIEAELERLEIDKKILPGISVAITVGSRGIANIAMIVKKVVAWVQARGGRPFLVPSMGSHGGATAEGQLGLLGSLGLSAENLGVPVVSSLETVLVGKTADNFPVVMDRAASRAGAIIVIARVKPHTDYRAQTESGLLKMLAIGLGKHRQALAIHRYGPVGLGDLVPRVAEEMIRKTPVLLGLAILENGKGETAKILALEPEEFSSQEPGLLALARTWQPQLPFDHLHVLVVRDIGKEISGTGMDTNVIGRVGIPGIRDFGGPQINTSVALNLTPASGGNALGIGLADFTTEKVMAAIDYRSLRENVITSTFWERGKLPLAFANDYEAIKAALRCQWALGPREIKMAFIENTKNLDRLMVSEALLDDLGKRRDVRILTSPRKPTFASDGSLVWGENQLSEKKD